MEINHHIIKELCKAAGANVTGIASADSFTEAPEGFRPIDKLKSCHSVIVMGCPFPQESLTKTTVEYTEIRNNIVTKLNDIAKHVAEEIKKKGFKSKMIGGLGGKWDNGRFRGHISLKHAAQLAGIGMIGRNYLLTNARYGNMLWFSAILTDAILSPDVLTDDMVCNNCNQCVETCPSGALNKSSLFGQKECYRTCYKTVKGKLELKCFACRKICPYRFGKDNLYI